MTPILFLLSVMFNSVILEEIVNQLSSESIKKATFERVKKAKSAVSNSGDSCLNAYEVDEHFIIRTEDSRKEGAEFLNETSVSSGEDCMHWCCSTSKCNVAVFDMKNKNSCYLFNCGTLKDFKCKFARHENYISAVLKVNPRTYDLSQWRMDSRHEEDLSRLKSLPTKLSPVISSTSTIQTTTVNTIVETPQPTLPGPKCGRFEFECHTGNMCIAIYNACDKIPQCPDRSDEIGCPTVPPPPPPPVPKHNFDDGGTLRNQNVQPGYRNPQDQNSNDGIHGVVYSNVENQNYQAPYPDQKNFYQTQNNPYYPPNPWYRPQDNPAYIPGTRGRESKPNIYNSAPIIGGDVYRPQDNLDYDAYNKYPNNMDVDYTNYPDNVNVWVGTGEDTQGGRRKWSQQPINNQGLQRSNGAAHEGTMHKSHSHGSSHVEGEPQNVSPDVVYKNGPENGNEEGNYRTPYQNWQPMPNQPLQNFSPGAPIQGIDGSNRQISTVNGHLTPGVINSAYTPVAELGRVTDVIQPSETIKDKIESRPGGVAPTSISISRISKKIADEIIKDEEIAIPSYTERSNGAALVLVLAFGLSITSILFVFVGCRVLHMRKRLRRSRSLSSNEADYLVNGMYL